MRSAGRPFQRRMRYTPGDGEDIILIVWGLGLIATIALALT